MRPALIFKTLGTLLIARMHRISPIEGFGIGENGCRFLEGNAVLAKVMKSLRGVPREHIYVYTLIEARWQEPKRPAASL